MILTRIGAIAIQQKATAKCGSSSPLLINEAIVIEIAPIAKAIKNIS
ncbi:hypothetical protein K8R43_01270 [archaeon]|nr:hypothetical protein [archaeon]